jgi:cellobiose-specific phosphotransferase system component IIB
MPTPDGLEIALFNLNHRKKVSHMTPLFQNGSVSPPLASLLKMTGVQHNCDITSVMQSTQVFWRQPTQHSGDIKDVFAHLKAEAKPFFEELGYIGEQTETRWDNYDYGYVCGAYILAVRKRLALLNATCQSKHIFFPHLVLAGGKRARHPVKESLAVLNNAEGGLMLRKDWQPLAQEQAPPTEDLIMEMVLMQSELPASWQHKFGHTVVGTPLRTDRPEKPNPSGEDVLKDWFAKVSDTRFMGNVRILMVYSQPQLRHLEITTRRILEPYNVNVDCIGYEAPGDINVSQVLDTIAKVIHELAKQ